MSRLRPVRCRVCARCLLLIKPPTAPWFRLHPGFRCGAVRFLGWGRAGLSLCVVVRPPPPFFPPLSGSDVRLRMAPTPGRRGRVPILFLLFGSAHAQFGNLEVKWQADASTGSKDARPSMGTPELMAKPDGKTRSTNLRSLTNERLEGIVTEFGLSCDLCTNAGHWISRVRSGGGCVGGESPPARTAQ